MTLQELAAILVTSGLPVVYRAWVNPPPLPYLVYYVADSTNFAADNKAYTKAVDCIVELYSNKKDVNTEQAVETVFDANDIYFEKTETWIADENLYEVAYSINV